jgi:hypothetical protein
MGPRHSCRLMIRSEVKRYNWFWIFLDYHHSWTRNPVLNQPGSPGSNEHRLFRLLNTAHVTCFGRLILNLYPIQTYHEWLRLAGSTTPRKPGSLQHLAGNCFEIIGNFVIFCNTFVVGWQAEKTPRNTTDQDSAWECTGWMRVTQSG